MVPYSVHRLTNVVGNLCRVDELLQILNISWYLLCLTHQNKSELIITDIGKWCIRMMLYPMSFQFVSKPTNMGQKQFQDLLQFVYLNNMTVDDASTFTCYSWTMLCWLTVWSEQYSVWCFIYFFWKVMAGLNIQ